MVPQITSALNLYQRWRTNRRKLALRRNVVHNGAMGNVELVEGASDAAIATFIHGLLRAQMALAKGPLAISVPGGTTPFPILQRLVQFDLDWDRVVVWPGDDRVVPEDHPASNTGKIRALFEPAGAQVVSLQEVEEVPHFGLVWLGMGGDGHIASLFPNTDPLVSDGHRLRRITPDPLPPEAPFDRITLTLPALLNSDALLFVIRGSDKRAVFEGAMRGAHDLPVARLLAAARQKVTCFL